MMSDYSVDLNNVIKGVIFIGVVVGTSYLIITEVALIIEACSVYGIYNALTMYTNGGSTFTRYMIADLSDGDSDLLESAPIVEEQIMATKNKNGIVQSRINIAIKETRFTPLKNSGNPSKAGWEHVLEEHFDRELANTRSIFSISPERLKLILRRTDVVKSPVKALKGGQFLRIVNVGEVVGNNALKFGGGVTTWIQIYTDRAGNLITTYPVPGQN